MRCPPLRAVLALATLAAAALLAASPTQAAPRLTVQADTAVTVQFERLSWQIEGPFAEQHWYVTLHNPSSRAVEATLRVPLDSDQRLRGYALDIDGVLRDAVPVERVKARVAFEDTIRGSVDPALAEKETGNAYRLRVFPVPAGGQRRVRIDVASLAERVACGWRHVLSPAVTAAGQRLPVEIRSTVRPAQASSALGWQPDRPDKSADHDKGATPAGGVQAVLQMAGTAAPLHLCMSAPAGPALYKTVPETTGGIDGQETAVPVMHWVEQPALQARTQPREPGRRIEVVWDASHGMPVDRSAEWALLQRYLARRDADVTLTVLRNDLQRQTLTVRSGDLAALAAALRSEVPDGATALRQWQPAPGVDEVLMFTDAVATWPGQGELAVAPVPVFVIATAIGDPALAQALVRQGGAVIELGRTKLDQALSMLTRESLARWRFGPQAAGWHVPSLLPQGGALRACHVSQGGGASAVQAIIGVSDAQLAAAASTSLAGFWCATWWVDHLQGDPDAHRSLLARIGQQFGVPNAETDLLVLERPQDYVRHGILPRHADAALQAAVLQQRQTRQSSEARALENHRRQLRAGWMERKAWWGTVFPKGDLPVPEVKKAREAGGEAGAAARARAEGTVTLARPAPMSVPAPAPMAAAPMAAPMALAADKRAVADAPATPVPSMTLKSVQVDAPYTLRLREARDAGGLYRTYLDLRAEYAGSPAFHFDVADRLFALGDDVRARRVLSNIVEMLPRDHAALRLVAYRLQQAGAQAEALDLLQRVKLLAPDEPQSWRDLGLALGERGDCRGAMEALGEVVAKPWAPRFADIGLIALAELNDLGLRCPGVELSRIDAELREPLPVGLRVALKWDLNDTDIDLHVTDPNGEVAFYGHRRTYQGGQMSRDFTAGYGPEEFVLRDPKPGRYRVEVNYFGSRQAKLSRGVVINVTLQTGFGTPQQRSQSVTARLLEGSGRVAVGSFEVAPGAGGLKWAPAP